jgi:creatinine amidohydrolase
MDRAVRRVPEWIAENRWVRFGGAVQFGWTSRDFGPDGLIGDPTGASPELGKELFKHSVAALADQLREISRFDFAN